MAKTVTNKTGFYIVDPDRKGAVPSKPKDAKDNESPKAYYARKYMEIHAAQIKKKGNPKTPKQHKTAPNTSHHAQSLVLYGIYGHIWAYMGLIWPMQQQISWRLAKFCVALVAGLGFWGTL